MKRDLVSRVLVTLVFGSGMSAPAVAIDVKRPALTRSPTTPTIKPPGIHRPVVHGSTISIRHHQSRIHVPTNRAPTISSLGPTVRAPTVQIRVPASRR